MTSPTMRVALLGAGRIGRLHARLLSELPGVELTISDTDPARAADLANEVGGRALDLEEAIAGAEALVEGIAAAQRIGERLDAPLRARVDAGSLRAGELGDELRRLGAAEVGLRQELEEVSERLTSAEVEIARIDKRAWLAKVAPPDLE